MPCYGSVARRSTPISIQQPEGPDTAQHSGHGLGSATRERQPGERSVVRPARARAPHPFGVIPAMTFRNPARRSRRPHRAGFTLLEIIIAVTIVAILAAVIVPRLAGWIGKAKTDRAKADAATLAKQVELYMTKYGVSRLPSGFALETLADGDDPMLRNRKQLLDPWDRPFEIRIPGQTNIDFDIISVGEDGELGTPDDIIGG